MAKNNHSARKNKKGGAADFKVAKLVYSVKSEKTNGWKFIEKNVRIPSGEKRPDHYQQGYSDGVK